MKLFKITLITFSSFVLLGLLAVAAFCFWVNPNDFKGVISEQVYKLTGRTLHINGDLHWSFYPALGMTVNQLTLDNAQGFGSGSFASIGKATFSVRLMPLLKKNIEANTIDIRDLQLNLIRNTKGQGNWDDLTARFAPSSKSTPAAIAPATLPVKKSNLSLEIPSINIKNAALSWQDDRLQQHATLQIVDFRSDSMNLKGNAFPLLLNMRFSTTKPALSGSLSLDGIFKLDTAQNLYTLKKFVASTQIAGPTIPNHSLSTTLTLQAVANLNKKQIDIPQLDLEVNGLKTTNNFTINYLNQHLTYQGKTNLLPSNLNQWLKTLGAPITFASADTLSRVSASMDIAGTDHSFNLSNVKANLDHSLLTGHINLLDFKKKIATFDLAVDRLALKSSALVSQSTTQKIATSTNTPVVTHTAAATDPFVALRTLNVKGHLAVDDFSFDDVKIKNMATDVTANQGLMTLGPASANLYDGHYTGTIRVDVSSNVPSIQLQQRLDAVNIHSLMQDLHSSNALTVLFKPLNGPANLSIQLASKGVDNATFTRNLQGTIQFSLENGNIEGINLQQILSTAVAILDPNAALAKDGIHGTTFASLKGSLTLNQGVIQPSSVTLSSSLFSVQGDGSVDLNTGRIDYALQIASLGPSIPVVNRLEKLLGGGVPIHISGTLNHPKIGMDPKTILSVTQQKIKENLGNSLKGLKALFR